MKLFWPHSNSLYYNKQLLCNKGRMKILFDLYQLSSPRWKRWRGTSHPRLRHSFICFCQKRRLHGVHPLWVLHSHQTMKKNVCVATDCSCQAVYVAINSVLASECEKCRTAVKMITWIEVGFEVVEYQVKSALWTQWKRTVYHG